MKKRRKFKKVQDEAVVEEPVVEEATEKEKIEEKVTTQIKKKRAKEDNKPSRILEYLKTEHKWENYLFLTVSVIVLMLGILILTGVLVVRDDFPLIGKNSTVYGWILVVVASLGTIYALYPFYKPCFPEFKKISWLKGMKFLGDIVRVFLFIIIFTLLFLLYDSFISQVLGYIF
ncbi:MAG: preprotein translocase subunit SecE [Acholeplasmatales bacterium]|nr:preprotein translocase subunit SecE [Acholeplasmatales bacterium]